MTSGYYTYFISSLPMLHFGKKAPFSFESFLERCRDIVSENDIDILKTLTDVENRAYDKEQPTLRRWRNFETSLRNELVKIRAARKHIDPSGYLRQDGSVDGRVAQLAMNAYKNPSMLESEKILDEERWQMLDESSIGHYFDIDFLIIYGLKLLILEKWAGIDIADKKALIENALQRA